MLVVEDGTGVAGADTYASLTAAADYWSLRPNSPFAAPWLAGVVAQPDTRHGFNMTQAFNSQYLGAIFEMITDTVGGSSGVPLDPSTAQTAARENALRDASLYVDGLWDSGWVGRRASAAQGLAWPRITPLAAPGVTPPLYRRRGISRPSGVWPYGDTALWTGVGPVSLLAGCDSFDETLVYDSNGLLIDALPVQVINATIEIAARALQGPLIPDYVAGQRLKSEKAGDQENVYFDDGADTLPRFGFLDILMRPLLNGGAAGGWGWA